MSNYQNVRSYYGINHRIRDLFSRDYFIFYSFWGGGGVLVGGVVTKYNPFKFSSLYFLKSGDVNVMC